MQQLRIISGKTGGAMKVVIYGPEGIGKSTLAAYFPRPLFVDTEGSTRFMDVPRTEKPTSWTMLLEQVQYVRDNPNVCSTLIIDTADWAEQLCTADICAKKRISGIEDMGYGKGYVYLGEEFGRLLNLLNEVVDRGVHTILTAHAKMRKFEQPDEMGAYDRWEMKLQQKTAPLVKEWADLVLFANYKTMSVAVDDKGKKFKAQGGRRVMYTAHHPCWDAKNRLGLPEELPLEYAPLAPYFNIDAPTAQGPAPSQEQPAPAPKNTTPATKQSVPAAPLAATQQPISAPNAEDSSPMTEKQATEEKKPESDALRALRDLMKSNNVYDHEIQAAVAARGYFPEQTPLGNYPDDFINGVLVGAWKQVYGWILDNKPLPF